MIRQLDLIIARVEVGELIPERALDLAFQLLPSSAVSDDFFCSNVGKY